MYSANYSYRYSMDTNQLLPVNKRIRRFVRNQIAPKLVLEISSFPSFDSIFPYRHLISGSFAFISSELT